MTTTARQKRALWLLRASMPAALTLTLAACGGDDAGLTATDAGAGVMCGQGTTKQGNQCVVASGSPDAGMVTALSCGENTVESDGVCIPDPALPSACGDGTVNQDGTCITPPVAISGLEVTHLALVNQGRVLDGTADNDSITEFYPLELSVGVSYAGDPAELPIAVALRPADAADTVDPKECFLAGLAIEHGGGEEATEAFASVSFDVPRGCLGDGQTTRKLVPVVYVDPDQTLNAVDPSSVSIIVAFSGPDKDDAASEHCHQAPEPGSPAGDCGIELNVVESPGVDFELESVAADSSVVVIDKCGDTPPHTLDLDAWKALVNDPESLDNDRPASYRCNSRIIPDFKIKLTQGADGPVPDLDADGNTQLDLDADGNPQIASVEIDGVTYPSFLYGEADLVLASSVLTHGETSSDITSDEEVSSLPDDEAPIAHNALADHGLQIRYRIRPASSDEDLDWRPLYQHSKGEQAKADGPTMSGQEREQFEDTVAVPATPTYYSHGLYLENDCGEKNKATCDDTLNPRDEVNYGIWANETNFTVQACLVPVTDAGVDALDIDQNPDNNCKDIEIRIVRRPTSGNSQQARTSYNFNNAYDRRSGKSHSIQARFRVHTYNTLDTSGASSDNEGRIEINSDLVGDRDLLKASYALSSDVGGVTTVETDYIAFDQTVNSYYRRQSRWHGEFHWGIHKEKNKRKNFHAGGFTLKAKAKVYGSVGTTMEIDLTSIAASKANDEEKRVLQKFPDSQRLGWVQLTLNPNGHVKARASVDFNAVVVRAGIKGSFTVFEMDAPIKGNLVYGVTSLNPLELRAAVWAVQDLEIDALHGKIYLYAKRPKFWGGWKKFWDKTLVHFKGWQLNQRLWSTPTRKFTLKR